MQSVIYLLDQFTPQFLLIEIGLLVFILSIFLAIWFYNRKKYQAMAHQIPAGVVKNYLDSIIQNSNSLKSSLFRGGGIELSSEGVPSVMPVGGLGGGDNVQAQGASSEEINRFNAEIASLKDQLANKTKTISDLETKLADNSGEVVDNSEEINELNATIEDLKKQLEDAKNAAPAEGGGDEEVKAQLDAITKERDELKEKLQEYEIIEDDLANLKKLQQENEMLKKSLEEKGGVVPSATEDAPAAEAEPAEEEAAAEEAPAAEAEPAEEEAPAEEAAEEAPAVEAQAEEGGDDVPQPEGDEKSAEDLLNEFEKMLG